MQNKYKTIFSVVHHITRKINYNSAKETLYRIVSKVTDMVLSNTWRQSRKADKV